MLLDRHRVIRLIELAQLEGRITGPDRLLREEEVALFIKAAYDDASDAVRAEFVARARQMPTSAWPWSAVQATGSRPPAALVLLRGQTESADVDPGNRIPDRGRPEATTWTPLHAALDTWDTAAIRRWITPRGWLVPAVRVSAAMSRPSGTTPPIGGNVGRPGGVRPPGNGGIAPPGVANPSPTGGGIQPVDTSGQPEVTWRHPAVIAAGATVLTTLGVALYSLGRSRGRALPSSGGAATEAKGP